MLSQSAWRRWTIASLLSRLPMLVSRSAPHRTGDPRTQYRDRSPPRCPRRPDLRIARPQRRDDDHHRHGNLRLRPNRPGPSRTERRLEIDHIRDVPDGHPRRRFCQVVASQKFVSEEPIAILRHSACDIRFGMSAMKRTWSPYPILRQRFRSASHFNRRVAELCAQTRTSGWHQHT